MRPTEPASISLGIATSWNTDLPVLFEFHILKEVRSLYQFDETLYGFNGNVVFANFHAARIFAKKMNDRRDLANHPERAVKAGQLNAMGLIDEICHFMIRKYEETGNPGVFDRALKHMSEAVGKKDLETGLLSLCTFFPPRAVVRKLATEADYLSQSTGGKPHAEVTLEEMIMVWLANINPAFAPFHELFADGGLRQSSAYTKIIDESQSFFQHEAPAGAEGKSLIDLLREPMLASPHSLEGQLAYIRNHWGVHLSKHFLEKMAGAGDLIREESKAVFAGGAAESVVPKYGPDHTPADIDREQFTADLDWMPNVVILAKNTYVWLDQLSRKYGRSITKLSDIPDEELDTMARWNLSGLWLIGVWERSPASRTMKQMMGNPEAVASAYSVYDYEIASDLGGEEAFQNLRHRAWNRGIRLAGDMVPNHVGICSKWVIEHPEYFVQTSYSPFPNYQFTGHNFSERPGVELRIEDGYWTRRDAAVVFQRVDTSTGNVQYIYHGNDGTSFPWNDTAQLNFLRAEVREAVIREIFHVAEKFSIIRFDAAMVLAKKHFQRLWYPEPGSGGDIPSRADHARSKEEFDRAFPQEFWREVVDRINRDKPNTLLLAEAFWLLEGYFVRTLGMHRVYNSAFMHMLMKEENAKYRELISTTLAYNPEILKRYVNFMSNPDERTAIDQFGKEDKYFGVAMLMLTLPGLPMFAHGQIEGLTEKYGMEYRKAYYDESPDPALVARHERELFPLLKLRYLFSQVTDFECYEFLDGGGTNEHVYAYSNSRGGEKTLICYNNRYESSSGTIGGSVPKVDANGGLTRGKKAGEALGLKRDAGYWYILRDHRTGAEFLRSGEELCARGLEVQLRGYEYRLFLDFREIYDGTGEYSSLAANLRGEGRASIADALRDVQLAPVHQAFVNFLDPQSTADTVGYFFASGLSQAELRKSVEGVEKRFLSLLSKIQHFTRRHTDVSLATKSLSLDLRHARLLIGESVSERFPFALPHDLDRAKFTAVILGVLATIRMADSGGSGDEDRGTTIADLRLSAPWERAMRQLIPDEATRRGIVRLSLLVAKHHTVMAEAARTRSAKGFAVMLADAGVREFLEVHEYQGTLYYKKEAFEDVVEWLGMISLIRLHPDEPLTSSPELTILKSVKEIIARLRNLSTASEFRLDTLIAKLEKHPASAAISDHQVRPA